MKLKSIITTYPDFRSLPKEIKKLLVASESFFFGETRFPMPEPDRRAKIVGSLPAFGNVWKN